MGGFSVLAEPLVETNDGRSHKSLNRKAFYGCSQRLYEDEMDLSVKT